MSATSSNSHGSSAIGVAVDAEAAEKQLSHCEEMVQHSLRRCPKVKFMREKLEKLGCEVPMDAFTCRPCEGMEISGGFIPPTKDAHGRVSRPEVVLCSDKRLNQTMMDHTMAHELIHAYDQCRVKLERSNCLHVACTEAAEYVNSAFKPCFYDTEPYDKNP